MTSGAQACPTRPKERAEGLVDRAVSNVDTHDVGSQRWTVARWASVGFLFGSMFPAVGWIVAASGNAVNVIEAHSIQPVLWIVDLAPFVLAVAGAMVGIQQSRLASALDATDQVVNERTAELRAANERLEGLMRSKDEFLASVSHELRTPLTVVSGFAQELLDEELELSGRESREILEVIAEQSRELANIIEDLLIAARADIGAVTIVKKPVDVADEVRSVVTGCVCTERERDSIECDLEPAIAEVDSTRLRQIVRNLLTNAIRYGGPTRRVVTRADNGLVTIQVLDDGDGIPLEDRARVFEAYERSMAVKGV
ncbi:MAG: sensor histidine kinase, partial [Acidimicrobiia bacterium]